MKLTLDQIQSIAHGAVDFRQDEHGIHLSRFTPEQQALYIVHDDILNQRSECAAGIRLHFRTNSNHLFLKANILKYSSRNFFSFDLYVNGEFFDTLDNFSHLQIPEKYFDLDVPMGICEKDFLLPAGENEICLHFPYTAKVELLEVSLDDGASLTPVSRSRKMLQFGDSITHGYDALRPSKCYSALIADALEAESINKGVGGEIYFPELAALPDPIKPDIITVAYGTNDWSGHSRESFFSRCRTFYDNLCRNYPKAKIFAIAPVWRTDWAEIRGYGMPFSQVAEDLQTIISDFPGVCFVPGIDLFPHEDRCFADGGLHPSDYGFAHYSENLLHHIRNNI